MKNRRFFRKSRAAWGGLRKVGPLLLSLWGTEIARGTTYLAPFGADPFPAWTIYRTGTNSGVRLNTGGNPDGYFVLTPAEAGQRAVALMNDLDGGQPVRGFDLGVDCRIGGGTAVPGDGLSINFMRLTDRILPAGTGFLMSPDGGADAAEEGTTTGISVALDSYDNGGTDVVGFTVRVDGVIVAQTGADLRNGAVSELATVQTGPLNPGGDPGALLGWARLRVVLSLSGRLEVYWKGTRVVEVPQTHWVPSAGRFVFAARTGAATQRHELDNLAITTTPAATAVTGLNQEPRRVEWVVDDPPGTVPAASLTLRINGNLQTLSGAVPEGTKRRLTWIPATPLTPGAVVTYVLQGAGGFAAEGTFKVKPYTHLTAAEKLPSGALDTSQSGVLVVPWQTIRVRPDNIVEGERQVRGLSGTNTANLTGAGADGGFLVPFVNFEENALSEGLFKLSSPLLSQPQDRLVPGIPGSRTSGDRDNFAIEATAYVSLASGWHRMGVHCDGGFRVSCGLTARSPLALEAGRSDGARPLADSEFDLYVDEPGFYPFRLLWYAGTGSSACEWYMVMSNGQSVPIGGSLSGGVNTLPVSVTSYGRLLPGTVLPAYPDWIEPPPGSTAPGGQVMEMTLANTGGTTPPVTLNGQPAGVRRVRGSSIYEITPVGAGLFWRDGGQTHQLAAVVGGETWYWSFTRQAFGELPEESWTARGTGRNAGFYWRMAQTAQSQPSGNDLAELILAGTYGANIATPSSPGNWTWEVSGLPNFSHNGAAAGTLIGDTTMPGLASPLTNAAGELLAFLEVPAAGFQTLAVASDDGFRLTPKNAPRSPLRILEPLANAGDLLAIPALNAPLPETPVIARPLGTLPADASGPLTNAAALAGRFALVDRSSSVLVNDQIRRSVQAGALGVILVQNNTDPPARLTARGFPAYPIPVIIVSQPVGAFIKLNPNSFLLSLGRRRSSILGEYDGPRGASETRFTFLAPQAGLYPVRLTYEQGGGGGNLEFYHFDAADGKPELVGTVLAGEPDLPMLYRHRFEPVASIGFNYLPISRQFRAFLPLTASDTLRAERTNSLEGSWTLVQEAAAPPVGSTFTWPAPAPPHPDAARQFFRFSALRSAR